MAPYYDSGGITIYHGDCREIVPQLGAFDVLLTDPPYGIGASCGVGKYGVRKWGAIDPLWDREPPSAWVLEMLIEHAARSIVWGMNYFSLPPTRHYLVWDKGAGFRARTFAECELAWCSWDDTAKVFTRDPLAERDYENKDHPTQTPNALFTWCLDVAGDVRTVLDPFAGTGTTAIAAVRRGCAAVLVERVERYCEIAAERLAQRVLPLSEPPGLEPEYVNTELFPREA